MTIENKNVIKYNDNYNSNSCYNLNSENLNNYRTNDYDYNDYYK